MALFEGAGVALITPFREDESVNYEELQRMLEYQIAEGIDAVIICGTTGEPVTMTEEERLSVIECAVETVSHRVPVIAGSGCNCTRDSVSFSQKAERLGVDGLLTVTPYYNKATQKGLSEHYKAIADSVSLPVILYNVPSRTGCNLQPATAAAIAGECPNVAGVKEASGNMAQVAELAALAGDRLAIYSGNDDQIIPVLSLGGKGVISVLANLAPKDTHRMATGYLRGNTKEALNLQLRYLPLIKALFCEVNPIPVKWAAKLMGLTAGGVRLPLTELSGEHRAQLEQAMREVGILSEM